MSKLIVEAFVVGLLTSVVGVTISYFLLGDHFFHEKRSSKSEIYKIILAFFLTGIIIHLGCEWSSLNKWYCRHGNACDVKKTSNN